jgi:hypothetical protein
MWTLPLFSIAAGFVWLSATLQARGFGWASSVCVSSWGLCGYAEWLLALAGLALAAYVLKRNTA